eukprot:Lithocolla_globosa_v1_NODE_8718_length_789_cov_49.663488.p1 type:complete len:211 gc:universal NODE_8718_length_789_cov_49.663488:106-738(+)
MSSMEELEGLNHHDRMAVLGKKKHDDLSQLQDLFEKFSKEGTYGSVLAVTLAQSNKSCDKLFEFLRNESWQVQRRATTAICSLETEATEMTMLITSPDISPALRKKLVTILSDKSNNPKLIENLVQKLVEMKESILAARALGNASSTSNLVEEHLPKLFPLMNKNKQHSVATRFFFFCFVLFCFVCLFVCFFSGYALLLGFQACFSPPSS